MLLTTHRGTSPLFSWLASVLSGAASSTSDLPPSPLVVHFLQTLTCSSLVLREPGAHVGSLNRYLCYDLPSQKAAALASERSRHYLYRKLGQGLNLVSTNAHARSLRYHDFGPGNKACIMFLR